MYCVYVHWHAWSTSTAYQISITCHHWLCFGCDAPVWALMAAWSLVAQWLLCDAVSNSDLNSYLLTPLTCAHFLGLLQWQMPLWHSSRLAEVAPKATDTNFQTISVHYCYIHWVRGHSRQWQWPWGYRYTQVLEVHSTELSDRNHTTEHDCARLTAGDCNQYCVQQSWHLVFELIQWSAWAACGACTNIWPTTSQQIYCTCTQLCIAATATAAEPLLLLYAITNTTEEEQVTKQ